MHEVDKTWAAYMATYLTPEEAQIARRMEDASRRLRTEFLVPAIALMRAGDSGGLRQLAASREDELAMPVVKALDELTQLQIRVAKEEFDASQSRHASTIVTVAAMLALFIALLQVELLGRRWPQRHVREVLTLGSCLSEPEP